MLQRYSEQMRRWLALLICGGMAVCHPVFCANIAEQGRLVIESIFPRGGRQGTEFDIVLRGKHLAGASRLRFSGAGVSARILESKDSEISARVAIDASAAVGRR